MSEEKIEFNQKFLVLANLMLLAWFFLAFLSVMFYSFLYSWLYLVFLAFMLYAVLRRLGCSNCYQCKTCTSGFGRLAGDFFGKGRIKKESVGNRLWLVLIIYFLLFVLPIVFLGVSLVNGFFYGKVLVLVALLAVSAYSLATWSKRSTAAA